MSRFVVHMRLAGALSKTVRQGSWLARIQILGAVGMLVLGLASVATGFHLALGRAESGKPQPTATFAADQRPELTKATHSYLDQLDVGRPAAGIGDGERAAASEQTPTSGGAPQSGPGSGLPAGP